MRRVGLFVVMIGALALSFSGQVAAVAPLLGTHLAVVFALTNDIASLLALHEVMSAANASVRRWSWAVLFLAGGTALGLNTWHAIQSAVLPLAASVAVGAGPVILAWVLSHVVALAMAADRRGEAASHQATGHQAVAEAPRLPVAEEVTRQVANQGGHQAAPTNPAQPGDLLERARKLLSGATATGQSMGRGRLARALDVTENQARQLLTQLASETGRQAASNRAGHQATHQVLQAA